MAYQDFRNLRGLFLRMLKSRNRAAYATLCREVLGKLAAPLDRSLVSTERRRINGHARRTLPIVFIIGGPRSGTTLVYQVLAHCLDVTYFSNVSALFPRATLSGARAFSWLWPVRSRSFVNYYGNTSGWLGPNAGFHVWDRWFGTCRYRPTHDITPDAQREMRKFLDAWVETYGKPLLNKNVRNTDVAPLLAEAIPDSYFISVRRDPYLVVQSLINARLHVQGSKSYGWGLYCREKAATNDSLGYVDDVCSQVHAIESQLTSAKEKIDSKRFMELDFNTFCLNPRRAVENVASFIPSTGIRARSLDKLKPFRPNTTINLKPEEQERMVSILQELSQSEQHHSRSLETTSTHA